MEKFLEYIPVPPHKICMRLRELINVRPSRSTLSPHSPTCGLHAHNILYGVLSTDKIGAEVEVKDMFTLACSLSQRIPWCSFNSFCTFGP